MKCQRQILRIRWQDHVRNDEVAARTGLRPVMESIRRRREAIFGHVARMSPNIPAHQALRLQVEASVAIDDLTAIGSAVLVVLATAGSTNSVRTINAHLLTYGEQPSGVVILERRYSPRRLRDDDDDDDIRGRQHTRDVAGDNRSRSASAASGLQPIAARPHARHR